MGGTRPAQVHVLRSGRRRRVPDRVTKIVRATCSASAPAFTTLPVQDNGQSSPNFPTFAQFSATRGGLWAGTAVATITAQFAVLTWRPGHQPTVIERVTYVNGSYQAGNPGSVAVAGIGPSGTVAFRMQKVHTNLEDWIFGGYVYVNGRVLTLNHAPSWTSYYPVAVADDGSILGVARNGARSGGVWSIVRWATPSAAYQFIAARIRNSGTPPWTGMATSPGCPERTPTFTWRTGLSATWPTTRAAIKWGLARTARSWATTRTS